MQKQLRLAIVAVVALILVPAGPMSADGSCGAMYGPCEIMINIWYAASWCGYEYRDCERGSCESAPGFLQSCCVDRDSCGCCTWEDSYGNERCVPEDYARTRYCP
jgi:hypothetical protein